MRQASSDSAFRLVAQAMCVFGSCMCVFAAQGSATTENKLSLAVHASVISLLVLLDAIQAATVTVVAGNLQVDVMLSCKPK